MFAKDRNGRSMQASSNASIEIGPRTSLLRKIWTIVKVVELRLRFIALLAATGLVFAYWETIWNHYEKWMRPSQTIQVAASGVEFFCPMHPHVVQDESGTCPICGMTLSKRQKSEKPELPRNVTARIELSPGRVSQAGIDTVEIDYAPLEQSITTLGSVAIDEREMSNIVSKVPGKSRVEKLYVNVTGARVTAGQPLAELFSPELNQAIEELQTAARRADEPVHTQTELGRSLQLDRQEMVRASAEKLKRFGTHPVAGRRNPPEGPNRLQVHDSLAGWRARFQKERRRGPGGAGRLPDVRGCQPAVCLGAGAGVRATARSGARRPDGRGVGRGISGREVRGHARLHSTPRRYGDPNCRGSLHAQ